MRYLKCVIKPTLFPPLFSKIVSSLGLQFTNVLFILFMLNPPFNGQVRSSKSSHQILKVPIIICYTCTSKVNLYIRVYFWFMYPIFLCYLLMRFCIDLEFLVQVCFTFLLIEYQLTRHKERITNKLFFAVVAPSIHLKKIFTTVHNLQLFPCVIVKYIHFVARKRVCFVVIQ